MAYSRSYIQLEAVSEKDDSPSGAKKVILWDLPYDKVSAKYRSAHQETKNLFISHLKYKKGIQTLTFTLSRKMAELQAIWTRKALPTLKNKIYRKTQVKKTMEIFTIGYEGIDRHQFLAWLNNYNINVVADVRNLPLSRKKGFSKTALSTLHRQCYHYQGMTQS